MMGMMTRKPSPHHTLGKPNQSLQRKPVAVGTSHKQAKPTILGKIASVGATIGRGLATAVGVVGKVAQFILDASSRFPFLKPILKFPVPIPGIGPVQVETLLKGVAITGRITERLANAMRVFAQGGSWEKVVAELPVADIAQFILAPMFSAFQGVFALLRVGKPVAPEQLERVGKVFKGLIQKIPKSLRGTVIAEIEKKLGTKLPGAIKNIREAVE
jgi:hypothetical protein